MTSIHWHEIPFVRICLPFIAGILTQQATADAIPLVAGAALTCILAVLTLTIRALQHKQQLRSVLLLAVMFCIGAFVRKSAEPSQHLIRNLAMYDGIVKGVITTFQPTEYGLKANLKIMTRGPDDIRAVAYLRDDITVLPYDTLVFNGSLKPFRSPANPYAFDIGKLYQRQGIYLRTYLDSTTILANHSYARGFHIMRKSAEVRDHVKAIFQKYVHQEQSAAVLIAMTIGVVDGLDNSIYDAYAKSGAIHVLSISGLHVGIVSALLFFLIGRVRSTDAMRIKVMRVLILLLGIWAFVFIAGLSPSVTRAALMSSIYLTGAMIGRPVKGLNVLAVTAFICLAIDPFQINSISFQFSYLALCGILVFFNPMYRLISVRSFGEKFIWGTVVMSVAAQSFLLPLLIHYFNQISIISLLSSLVAVPASYGILAGGILLLTLHYVLPVVAGIVGWVIDVGIQWVNQAIIGMSQMPLSHLTNVYLPPVEVVILSVITTLFALRILTRQRIWTKLAVLGIVIFGGLHVKTILHSSHYELLAIYPHEKQVAIDYISERNCFTTFNADSMPVFLAKEVAAFRNASRVRLSSLTLTSSLDSDNHVHVFELPGQGTEDYCYRLAVITESEFDLLSTELLSLQADWIILSSGLNYKMRRAAEEFCIEHQLPFHDLREHGTFYLAKLKNQNAYETSWQNISG